MNNRTIFKSIITGFVFFALLLFVGRGFTSYGQTSTLPIGQQQGSGITSDFQHDVEEGKQQVNNDKDAQNNQHEIDNEEDEKAGDQHGDQQVIDGEKSEGEVEQEVENEVKQEGDQGSQQSDENSAASSTGKGGDNSDGSVSSTGRD